MTDSPLMLIKVLLIVAMGAAFIGWQLYDLEREKKRAAAKNNPPEAADRADSAAPTNQGDRANRTDRQ